MTCSKEKGESLYMLLTHDLCTFGGINILIVIFRSKLLMETGWGRDLYLGYYFSSILLTHSFPNFFCSYGGQSYKYNGVAPLPAQRNLTPPPTLYLQQPMSSSSENYRYHRFSSSSIPDSGGGRTSRADINIWLSVSPSPLPPVMWKRTWCLVFLNPSLLIFRVVQMS